MFRSSFECEPCDHDWEDVMDKEWWPSHCPCCDRATNPFRCIDLTPEDVEEE